MKINNLFRVVVISSLALIIGSCSDRLDIPQHSVSPVNGYYQTDAEAEEGVTTCYTDMRALETGMGTALQTVKELLSDNVWTGGGSHYDGSFYHLNDYTFSSDYSAFKTIYKNLYNLIYSCNTVLEKITDETPVKKRARAEALVFRAYANFQLVTLWGTAPLVTKTLSESEYMQGNSTTEALWNQVEQDLTDAIASGALTSKKNISTPTSRVTKEFAEALLGKAYLFQKKYAEAAKELDLVINSGLYALNPDLTYNGTPNGDNDQESIFEVNCLNDIQNTTPNNNFKWIMMGLRAEKYSYSSNSPLCKQSFGYLQPRKDLYDAFVKVEGVNGYRLNNTILTLSQLNTVLGAKPAMEVTDNEGYFNYKYRILQEYFSGYFYANNTRIMKFNEVLLLSAEAHFQNGDQATAIKYINQIRDRAKAPEVASLTMDDIKTESRLELYLEGQRYENLIRWGDAATALEHNGEKNPALEADGTVKWTSYNKAGECGFVKGKNELWPFPAEEINVNHNMKQNNGY